MSYDKDKVDEMALALLYLSSFTEKDGRSAWKGFDWEILNRLHEKGYISNPKNKNKSVAVTEAGVKLSEELFTKFFADSTAAESTKKEQIKAAPTQKAQPLPPLEDDEPPIYLVNRQVAYLRAKEPYLIWLQELEIPDLEITLIDLQRDGTSILIPEVETPEQALEYIETVYEDLFEMALAAWSQDDEQWPEPFSWPMFNEWFDIEIHSMVVDLSKEPLKREEFL